MLEFKNEQLILDKINKLKNKTKTISAIRLILAVLFIILVIITISIGLLPYGIISLAIILSLLIFIFFTNKYYDELILLERKELIYTLHKKRRNLEYASFFDTGIEFSNPNDYKLADLDIFGSNSIYQYLNSSKTKYGRKNLARQLSNPIPKSYEYTECIMEMTKCEEIIDIEASLLGMSSNAKTVDYEEFISVINNKIEFKLTHIIPLLTLITSIVITVLSIFGILNPIFLILIPILNFSSVKLFLKNDIFKLDSSSYNNLCESYINVSNTITRTNINSNYYNDLKIQINNEISNFKTLNKIYSLLSMRKNIVFNILFNSICVIDYWVILLYNKTIKASDSINSTFEAIAEIEAMISFSNIGIDGNIYSIPQECSVIEAEDMIHPLIKDCVSNSIRLINGIILTGSNMSGKTTFMRTLGINQLLFNAGSIVPSKSYKAPKMPVLTSLRANDMLVEGVSTFYAEILRMKLINETIEDSNALILVDEIFKGTNAKERIEASLKIIEKLVDKKIIFIISTHDYELCDAKGISNYHFSEYYKDDKIYFDYLLKDGKCESKNAIYLLKMAKII